MGLSSFSITDRPKSLCAPAAGARAASASPGVAGGGGPLPEVLVARVLPTPGAAPREEAARRLRACLFRLYVILAVARAAAALVTATAAAAADAATAARDDASEPNDHLC